MSKDDSAISISRGAVLMIAGGLLIILGLLACLGWVITLPGYDEMERFTTPGSLEMRLTDPGPYTIYREYGGNVNVRNVSVDYDAFDVRVENARTAETIPLSEPSARHHYSVGQYAGVSAFTFTIDSPDGYVIMGSADEPITFAIGSRAEYVTEWMITGLLLIVAGIFLGFVGYKRL